MLRADLPADVRERDSLRRLKNCSWAIAPDPLVVRAERLLAPLARWIRNAIP